MVIVLGLLNNISYGPQSGGTFCTQGGRVVVEMVVVVPVGGGG